MNSFAMHHRELKVAKLLAKVPLADTLGVREALAKAIETNAPAWRLLLVTAANVPMPRSEETWKQLAMAVPARPLATEAQVCAAAFERRRSA